MPKPIESTIHLLRNSNEIPVKFKSISDIYLPTSSKSSNISNQESVALSNLFHSVNKRKIKEKRVRASRLKQIFFEFSERPTPRKIDHLALPYPERCESGLDLMEFNEAIVSGKYLLMLVRRGLNVEEKLKKRKQLKEKYSTEMVEEHEGATDWQRDGVSDSQANAEASESADAVAFTPDPIITNSCEQELTGNELKAVLWSMNNLKRPWDYWRTRYQVKETKHEADVSVVGTEILKDETSYTVSLLPTDINVEAVESLLEAPNSSVVLAAAWEGLYGGSEGLKMILKEFVEPWAIDENMRKTYEKPIRLFGALAKFNMTKTSIGAAGLLYFTEGRVMTENNQDDDE